MILTVNTTNSIYEEINDIKDNNDNFNTLIWNLIMDELKTRWDCGDRDDLNFQFNFENRYRWIFSHSLKQEKDKVGNPICCYGNSKVVCKTVESGIVLPAQLNNCSNNDNNEENFKKMNKVCKISQPTYDSSIPIYFQYLCTIKKVEEILGREDYDKYVWYYEYMKLYDHKKPLNGFSVIRFEATDKIEREIIEQLEQGFYEYRCSNSKEQKEIILKFKDKEGKDCEYRAKFFNSHIGGVGAIIFKGTNSNINSRNLFRYPNYEKSKFEKEDKTLLIFSNGFKDPYGDERPIPIKSIQKTKITDNLKKMMVKRFEENNDENAIYCVNLEICNKDKYEKQQESIKVDIERIGGYGDGMRAPTIENQMNDKGPIRINGLDTNQGNLLPNYKPEWSVAIDKIIDMVSKDWDVSIKEISYENYDEEEKVQSTKNLNIIRSIEIDNSTKGFNALMFFTKLHFLDCIFTNSFYPNKTNRNDEFSAFIYPLEWEIDKENLEETTYFKIHDYSNKDSSENDDIRTSEIAGLYNKIQNIRLNSSYSYVSKPNDECQFQFFRIKEVKSFTRIQNMKCYIGYRLHYHLLQMLGRKDIKELEYCVTGHKKDLLKIAKYPECYLIHDLIKQFKFKMYTLEDEEFRLQLDCNILLLRAIVEEENIDGTNVNVIKAIYPSYMISFTDWKEPNSGNAKSNKIKSKRKYNQ